MLSICASLAGVLRAGRPAGAPDRGRQGAQQTELVQTTELTITSMIIQQHGIQ